MGSVQLRIFKRRITCVGCNRRNNPRVGMTKHTWALAGCVLPRLAVCHLLSLVVCMPGHSCQLQIIRCAWVVVASVRAKKTLLLTSMLANGSCHTLPCAPPPLLGLMAGCGKVVPMLSQGQTECAPGYKGLSQTPPRAHPTLLTVRWQGRVSPLGCGRRIRTNHRSQHKHHHHQKYYH